MAHTPIRIDGGALPLGVGPRIASPINYYLERMALGAASSREGSISLGDPYLGILVYGAPGTGKSEALRAIIDQVGGERGLYVSAADLAQGDADVMDDITSRLRTALETGEPTFLAIGRFPGNDDADLLDLSAPIIQEVPDAFVPEGVYVAGDAHDPGDDAHEISLGGTMPAESTAGATGIEDESAADGGDGEDSPQPHQPLTGTPDSEGPDPRGAARGRSGADAGANRWQAAARQRARGRRRFMSRSELDFEGPSGAAAAVDRILATVRAKGIPAVVIVGSDLAPHRSGLDLFPSGQTQGVFHGYAYSGLPDRGLLESLWGEIVAGIPTDGTVDVKALSALSDGLTVLDITWVVQRAFAKTWELTGGPIDTITIGQLDVLAALKSVRPKWVKWFNKSYLPSASSLMDLGSMPGVSLKSQQPTIPQKEKADLTRFERGMADRQRNILPTMRATALATRAAVEAAGGESGWDSLLNQGD